MKRVLWMLPLAAAVCAAQSAETRQARGKRVVDEAVQALGGQAFLHMQDRVETGRSYSFDNGKLSGTIITTIYTRYLPPVPGKVEMLEKDAFGKDEQSGGLLFTMDGAWDFNFHGARPMDEQRLANYQDNVRHNIIYILRQRLNEPGMSFYSQLSDLWENRPVEIVDITDAENNTVTVYFGQNDKLPVRQTFRRRNTTYNDFDTEATLFAKYHQSEGINWPMDIRRDRNGVKIYEMYTDSVEFNKSLKDSVFTLPAKLKVLPKGK
jgi:hypothetical protein